MDDPQVVETLTLDSDGNGSFTDPDAGSFDWSSQFYQLVCDDESSAIFGYVVEPIDGDVGYPGTEENNAPVENLLVPLDPGTANSALTANSFWYPDGSHFGLSYYSVFFDDSTDEYDHAWLNPGWESGDSISFGYGDTLWLNDFPVSGDSSSLVTLIGFMP